MTRALYTSPSMPTHLPWTAHYPMPNIPIGPASSSPKPWHGDKIPCFFSHLTDYIQPLKMELTQASETSANYNLTPGKYPKEHIQYSNHGKSLKSVEHFMPLMICCSHLLAHILISKYQWTQKKNGLQLQKSLAIFEACNSSVAVDLGLPRCDTVSLAKWLWHCTRLQYLHLEQSQTAFLQNSRTQHHIPQDLNQLPIGCIFRYNVKPGSFPWNGFCWLNTQFLCWEMWVRIC